MKTKLLKRLRSKVDYRFVKTNIGTIVKFVSKSRYTYFETFATDIKGTLITMYSLDKLNQKFGLMLSKWNMNTFHWTRVQRENKKNFSDTV